MLMPLDLETTGLKPDNDVILEIAYTFVRDDFSPLTIDWYADDREAVTTFLVRPRGKGNHPGEWDPYVREMHTKNGLIRDLETRETVRLPELDARISNDIDIFTEMVPGPVMLLGQSPQGVDRPFIERYLPETASRLSYRHFDVRTLMDFFAPLGIEHNVENAQEHRAADDVRWSLSVAREYHRVIELLSTGKWAQQ